ncbi:type II secretion system F family protein [Streptomonospora sp. NEAU-YY374]|uniref:Type II secretion system protein GspF domain-containing protein n=1 Tax=Streptomonospora nanhaiensis TaxID=1323731 RepID=A0A853BSE9_9ACTN|nr:type II secretion system F family protein [Streptomonospora nanhaiensis]NYI98308.1 hypothetical protein [Streptomonospora nanhaiensis]
MSVLVAGVAGAAAGAGLWMLARAARRPSLADLLALPAAAPPSAAKARPAARLGRSGAKVVGRAGLPSRRVRADLAVTGTAPEQYLAEKACAAAAASALAVFVIAATLATGRPASPLTLVAAAACAASCWMAPDLALRSQARARRAQLRSAACLLADLAVIALAGGAGVAGALAQAARHGHGWAPEQIRTALHAAALRRQPAWSALSDLADRTAVSDLGELAASLHLAGTDGARVRASLTAKAQALRTAELAEAEARAAAQTERMTLPVTVLVLGFMVLIGYPALVHVVTGF